ncbi:MAG TPA: ATP-binding protein [Leptospiraceae bacterium]|nr:ATP-binding protein [Leptospiraceae bacterium]
MNLTAENCPNFSLDSFAEKALSLIKFSSISLMIFYIPEFFRIRLVYSFQSVLLTAAALILPLYVFFLASIKENIYSRILFFTLLNLVLCYEGFYCSQEPTVFIYFAAIMVFSFLIFPRKDYSTSILISAVSVLYYALFSFLSSRQSVFQYLLVSDFVIKINLLISFSFLLFSLYWISRNWPDEIQEQFLNSFENYNHSDLALMNSLYEKTLKMNHYLSAFKSAVCSASIVSESDLNGRITAVNDKFCKVTGYSEDELIGQSHNIVNSGFHSKDFFQEIWNTISNGFIWRGEIRNRKKNGEFYWVDSFIIPLLDENEKPIKYISIRNDITDKKRNEEQLIDQKDKAQRLSRQKIEILSMMSHEIRNPLNSILGITELLLDSDLKAEQLKMVSNLKFTADNLIGLVNNILDSHKIKSGKLTLEETVFNLELLLKNIIDSLYVKARQKNNELVLEVDPQLPRQMMGDPLRLFQIFMNLLSNSIKFTENGYVKTKVYISSETDDAVTVFAEVSDNGIGIPSDKLDTIFETYSQAEISTSRKFGGTGLGLSIVKSLLELFHSKIQVESELNKGSRFYFYLTLKKSVQNLDKVEEIKPMQVTELSGIKLLLAEDNLLNVTIVGSFLKKWGIRFSAAQNGKEVIGLLSNEKFDLVLMDLQMPVMNGYEAIHSIRNSSNLWSNVPIVAMSAESLDEVKDSLEKYSIKDYISKPFNPSQLREKIVMIMKKNYS